MNTEPGIKICSGVEGSTFLPLHHIIMFVSQQHIYRLGFFIFTNLQHNQLSLNDGFNLLFYSFAAF